MRCMLVCTALCMAWPASASALFIADADFTPKTTSFAYAARHDESPLPASIFERVRPDGESFALDGSDDTTVLAATPKTVRQFSRNELCNTAASAAEANNLPIPFFANLIQQESGWKPHVVSHAGAQGIAQFMPKVAASYGLTNPFDPIHALAVSAKFLRELLSQFGNLGLAAAAYNAGPKRVQDWMARRGKLPAETRNYVQSITGRPADQWVRPKSKAAGLTLPPHARCPDLQTMEARVVDASKAGIEVVEAAPPAARKIFKLASADSSMPVVLPPTRAAKMPVAKGRGVSRLVVGRMPKLVPVIMAAEKPVKIAVAQQIKGLKTSRHAPIDLKRPLASAKPLGKASSIRMVSKPAVKPVAAKRIKVAAAR